MRTAAEQIEAVVDSEKSRKMSSASVQIAIVLASASIITTIPALFWTAGALGVVGVAFCVIGFWFPTAVHLF